MISNRLFQFIALTFSISLISASAFAGGTPPTGGGGCNWDAYLDRLATQESGRNCGEPPNPACKASEYTVIRDACFQGRRDASWGRYQFIPSTWSNLVRSQYPQCVRYHSNADLPNSCGYLSGSPNPADLPNAIASQCHAVQDWAAIEFTRQGLNHAQNNNWCGLLGQTVSGTHIGAGNSQQTCVATQSGILSAIHNAGSCRGIQNGATSHYMSRICSANGIAIPGDCNPSNPSPGQVTPPTGGIGQGTPTNPPQPQPYPANDPLKELWVATLQLMTEQIVATMMQQVQIIGAFFDAKHQLETQRLMQQKTAEAHKRYHPSEEMCKVGTFVRNLAQSERRAILTQAALSRSAMDRALKARDAQTSEISSDEDTVENAYLTMFCTPDDNAGQNGDSPNGQHTGICQNSTANAARRNLINADINYTKTIDLPLTLEIDVLNGAVDVDEPSVFSLMDHLFMHKHYPYITPAETELSRFVEPYMEMRSLIAIRGVAQNSLAYIIGEKAAGSTNAESVAPFLKAMLNEMGITNTEADEIIGDNPSYYAQMDFLTRQIYYHPQFVSNLYDKPANVKRMAAAMTAIKSMQQWQISEALKRREMLFSMLLELKLREKQRELEAKDIPEAIFGDVDYIGNQ